MSRPRVVLAEDSTLLRAGLVSLLEEGGFAVAGAVGDGESLLAAVAAEQPDVCVVDVRLPPTFSDEGLRAALAIRAERPGAPVLVLSQYVEERYATELVLGDSRAVGYLLKDRVADVGDFLDALRRVTAGGTVLDPEVVTQLLARSHRRSPLADLTPRETQVLRLMAEGRTNTAIAAVLRVSEGAVEKHISAIFAKLGLLPTGTDHRRVLAVVTYLRS